MESSPKLASFDDCLGCMLCHDVCPRCAIDIKENKNGYWMPFINSKECIGCLLCEKKCKEVRQNTLTNRCKRPLRAYNQDNDIRARSASGGAFAAIAEHMIHRYEAVVIGATLHHNKVYHIAIQTAQEINKLQGSKYIQSNTKGIYRRTRDFLEQGRYVLFSGTPCQVQALNIFLKKPYKNLLTIDLICHGVISNYIFTRHLEINPCDEVIAFRDKSLGWGKDSFFKTKTNGKTSVDTNWRKNYFYHVFQLETCVRANCYKCQYCQLNRASDITLGDYWADKKNGNYDKLGLSSILCNTAKGVQIVSNIKKLNIQPADWSSTIKPNPRLVINRPTFQSFSCNKHIGLIYRYIPDYIADRIVGTWYSKRNLIFFPWLKYILQTKKKYELQYQEYFKSLKL